MFTTKEKWLLAFYILAIVVLLCLLGYVLYVGDFLIRFIRLEVLA